MNFKLIFTYACIILDVVIFPFSCIGNHSNEKQYIFVICIEDEAQDVFYHNQYVDDISENMVINYPKDWEYVLPEGYQLTEWQILDSNHEPQNRDITFPYEITEDDIIRYFEGHRNCVVFKSLWEYIDDADH
ncbi:MAG: hypothetical protein K2N64_06105 [Anaeroplasmataceae bacterium]|nr:hypothetical protein [Anaeroplasmataceae bacterium]